MTTIRIHYEPTGELLAEGPKGWGITPFEGNYYVRRKFLSTSGLRINFLPGLCIYKFLYVWMDLHLANGTKARNIAWIYWLPNPILPFIWWRVALPGNHPDLHIEVIST